MNNSSQKKRWYDEDPTLSLAVSFIKNSSAEQQRKIAEKIIEKAISLNISANETKIIIQRRWHDEDEKLSLAMNHLQEASQENRKIIALDIIEFLTEIKA